MNMHTHATHTYILHGEFLFIQLHSIRCNTVWQPLGRPVTSVVVVADGCLSCMFVCVCVFICIVFFWQRRRTALLCSNSPLCTQHLHIPMRTTARTHTYTHAHTELLLSLLQRRRRRRWRSRCFHFFSPQRPLSKRIRTRQWTVVLNGKQSKRS